MSFTRMSRAELLAAARTLYTGARDDAEITAALADYDYTAPDDFDAGLALVTAYQEAITTQSAEYADQFAATRAAQQATEEVRNLFAAHRRIARRRHPRGSEGYTALRLHGPLSNDREVLLAAAATFYGTLAERPDLHAGVRGLADAQIAEALAAVEAARAAHDARAREAAEAQDATEALTTAEGRLRAEAGELAEVARIALAGRPQLLEKLGLLARS